MTHGYPDYEGDKSGLYLKPEWAAKEGIDLNLLALGAGKTWGQGVILFQPVLAGQTLFITQVQCAIFADAALDSELNNMCSLSLVVGVINVAYQGGNGGVSLPLPKPIVIVGVDCFSAGVTDRSNPTCSLVVSAQGYLVTA